MIKYPKPGFDNPIASIHVFDLASYLEYPELLSPAESTAELQWTGRFPLDNSVLSQVTWLDDSTLIVKEVNRAAYDGNVVLFSFDEQFQGETTSGVVVRRLGRDGEEADEGWIDPVSLLFATQGFLSIRS